MQTTTQTTVIPAQSTTAGLSRETRLVRHYNRTKAVPLPTPEPPDDERYIEARSTIPVDGNGGEAASVGGTLPAGQMAFPPTMLREEPHFGRRLRFLSALMGVGGPQGFSKRVYGHERNSGTVCNIMGGRQKNVTHKTVRRYAKALGVTPWMLVHGDIGTAQTQHFGHRLRAYRELNRITVREVAKLGAMSTSTVTKWESRPYPPTDERILNFSVALDVPYDELIAYARLAPKAPTMLDGGIPISDNISLYNERVRRAGFPAGKRPTLPELEETERKIAEFNSRHHEEAWRERFHEQTRQEPTRGEPTRGEPTREPLPDPADADGANNTGGPNGASRMKEMPVTMESTRVVSAMQALLSDAVEQGKTITITINPR